MTDQTTLSFASKSTPADGVAVVFADEGPELSGSAEDLDKKSKGLLTRAIGITEFQGQEGADGRSHRSARPEIHEGRGSGPR